MNFSLSAIIRSGTFVASLAFAIVSVAAAESSSPLTAADLAARLSALRQDGSSYVRVRLEIKGGGKDPLQLQIKERRTKAATEVVYQVLFPKERKGESVLLRKIGNRPASGAVFIPPNTVRELSAGDMRDGLFGSDLAYEDVVENFFAWDQQAIVATEDVDSVACQVLESKPGKGDRSIYSSVKSWIDVRRMVPLRVEKFSGSGQSARRIDTTRVAAVDGRSLPANLLVRVPGRETSTALDGSRIKRDVTFSDLEFTTDGLKELSVARGSAE
jgi:hypothetical protein